MPETHDKPERLHSQTRDYMLEMHERQLHNLCDNLGLDHDVLEWAPWRG